MSVIVASGETISRSPINTSKSKQMFSFPKASRFPELRKSLSCTFYDLPGSLTKRSTSFGLGTKYDFTKGQKGINPQFYTNKSDFDQTNPSSPRFSFGIGRDKYGKVYYESNKMFDKYIPGPAKYNILRPFGHDALKYTMSSRFKLLNTIPITPGPGQYKNILQINERSRYACDKSQRSKFSLNKNPGPADYPQKPLIGLIFNSKHSSSPRMAIHQKLHPFSRNNYPGPGTYRIFSEFGIYESKYASQTKVCRGNPIDKPTKQES